MERVILCLDFTRAVNNKMEGSVNYLLWESGGKFIHINQITTV